MLRMELTEEAREALRYERFHHPHPRVQRRMDAVLLKSYGLPHAQIASIVGIEESTLRSYLEAYKADGIEKLKEVNWPGAPNELATHQDTLKAFFWNIPRRLWPRRLRRSPN
jgi:Winged helix-turn helix